MATGKRVGGGGIHARSNRHVLEFRRVGVLSVNINGFQHAASAMGNAGTGRTQAAVTRLVEQCVGEERGIVDYFHGDRFVCGFNTARMCGNVGASAGQASVKLWESFRADAALSGAFPHGLSMGLSTGKAAVGNHGSDTMQRLGTIGYVFTEAMRLQEVMSRRVLSSPSSIGQCLGGRCLVMGRTLLDVDTSLAYQVIGTVPAGDLMPAADSRDPARTAAFAKAKNRETMKVCGGFDDASIANGDARLELSGQLAIAVLVGPKGNQQTSPPNNKRATAAAGANDEWLYQLAEEAPTTAAYRQLNAIVCRLVTGQPVEAADVLGGDLSHLEPNRHANNNYVANVATSKAACSNENGNLVDSFPPSPLAVVDTAAAQHHSPLHCASPLASAATTILCEESGDKTDDGAVKASPPTVVCHPTSGGGERASSSLASWKQRVLMIVKDHHRRIGGGPLAGPGRENLVKL